MSLFRCEQVTRNYGGQPVVRDVSVSLEPGQMASLLGASGVGKTTLFHVLSGVDRPDQGRVFLEDEEITGQAGRVSYMLQKDLLLPYKTIVDNVSLPLVLRGVKKTAAREQAASHFARFGLAGYEKSWPHQLSGGMRQRAALLRTWLLGNDVILLDEPFSALDALTKLEMHRWYLEIIGEIGVSTLFITHDVDEAIALSDKIYILAGVPGQITREISIGPPRPRPSNFSTSPGFMAYKRDILEAIGLAVP